MNKVMLAALLMAHTSVGNNIHLRPTPGPGKERDTNKLKLTPDQQEHLKTFASDRAGIKAKRVWLKNLEQHNKEQK